VDALFHVVMASNDSIYVSSLFSGPAEYPVTGDPCAYCRQPLNVAAVQLVKKYRDFTNNQIRATLDKNNLTGVLRTLTEAAKDASEELLNKDFGKRAKPSAGACAHRT
jgi:hypothetical protein